MKLTIEKFQKLNNIALSDLDDIDKAIEFVRIFTGQTVDDVEKMNVDKFNKLCDKVNKAFNEAMKKVDEKPSNWLIVKGKVFYINYNIAEISANKYVETAVFGQNLIENLHKVMATMVYKTKLTWKGYKIVPYDAADHEKISELMLQADFKHCYHLAVFFLSSFQKFNSKFETLYGAGSEGQGEAGSSVDRFHRDYGWIANAKMVSEFEGISLDEAWNLPTLQFINDLVYLKLKMQYDEHKSRTSKSQSFR